MADRAGVPALPDGEETARPRPMRLVRGSLETRVIGLATQALSDDGSARSKDDFFCSVRPPDSPDPLDMGTTDAITPLSGCSGDSGIGSCLTSSAMTSNSLRVSSKPFGRPTNDSSCEGVTSTVGREEERCGDPLDKSGSVGEGQLVIVVASTAPWLSGCVEMGAVAAADVVTPAWASLSAFGFPRRPCHSETRDAKLAVEFDMASATNDGIASISDSGAAAGRVRVCGFSHPIPCRLFFFTLRSASDSSFALSKAAKDGVGMSRHGPVCIGAGMQSDVELGTAPSTPSLTVDTGAAGVETAFEGIDLNTFLGDLGIEVRRVCVRDASRWWFSECGPKTLTRDRKS